ncbi:hypothetical protein E4T38_03159 [Aureobasidium subglaciale]|nr:hypothetical protein E4T38_03159 [Aureobasidium subglaciale]KAI5226903.1 hypothetical protein E4T40_02933 [Aureobasidium subglaciale]KAI5230167.1 hypothetical protein E4T41_03156 [Aureobasidium subglaciale]KAI5264626.1 hypothetical protein E4T46_02934 [Aureobasidium subglaciale]
MADTVGKIVGLVEVADVLEDSVDEAEPLITDVDEDETLDKINEDDALVDETGAGVTEAEEDEMTEDEGLLEGPRSELALDEDAIDEEALEDNTLEDDTLEEGTLDEGALEDETETEADELGPVDEDDKSLDTVELDKLTSVAEDAEEMVELLLRTDELLLSTLLDELLLGPTEVYGEDGELEPLEEPLPGLYLYKLKPLEPPQIPYLSAEQGMLHPTGPVGVADADEMLLVVEVAIEDEAAEELAEDETDDDEVEPVPGAEPEKLGAELDDSDALDVAELRTEELDEELKTEELDADELRTDDPVADELKTEELAEEELRTEELETAATFWYMLRPEEPPQISVAFPAQGILQRPSVTGAEPDPIAFPQ